MTYTLIESIAQLNAIEADWKDLERHATLPMQTFFWTRAIAEALQGLGRLRVLALMDSGHIVGLAPLFQRFKSPVYELLGVQEFSEPSDLLVDPAFARPMAELLAEWGYLLWLNRIPKESPTVPLLESVFHKRGVIIKRPERSCPTLPLTPAWKNPDDQLNAGRRSDLRRAQRHAESLGKTTYEIHEVPAAQAHSIMDDVFAVEAASWKGRARSAMPLDPLRGPFYRAIAHEAAQAGILRVAFMKINGEPAAMQYALEFDSRLWLLKISYVERFARCSPGTLLLRHLIAYAASRSLRAIEFLGTNEPWIQVWTRDERACLSLRAYPFDIRGMRRFAGDVMKSAFRKLERAA